MGFKRHFMMWHLRRRMRDLMTTAHVNLQIIFVYLKKLVLVTSLTVRVTTILSETKKFIESLTNGYSIQFNFNCLFFQSIHDTVVVSNIIFRVLFVSFSNSGTYYKWFSFLFTLSNVELFKDGYFLFTRWKVEHFVTAS